MHAGMMDAATSLAGAVKKQAVQDRAGVNDDGMRQIQRGALILRADEFDFLDEFFWKRIIEQERETLRGFVGETAATRLFPREMLIENVYGVAGASELLATHGSRRPTTDNDIVSHSSPLNTVVGVSAGGMTHRGKPSVFKTMERAPDKTQREV